MRDANSFPRFGATVSDLRRVGATACATLASPDGRWTLVSTIFTALVSGAITWLTLAAEPTGQFEPRHAQASLSYDLIARLTGRSPGANASLVPGLGMPAGASPASQLGGVVEQAGVRVHYGPDKRTLRVDQGDTLIGMLTEAGVPSPDAAQVVAALAPVYSPRNIQPGQVFQASFGPPDAAADEAEAVRTGEPAVSRDNPFNGTGHAAAPAAKLLSLSFSPDVEHRITVKLNDDGEYDADDVETALQARYAHAGATIQSGSLYLAAMQAGIPASVVVEMMHMFSYDVDFQRDVRPGDSFEVFYNGYYTPEGREAKAGDIAAATMVLNGVRHTLYRFETADGVEYFDANGKSAKNMLMKTPVDGARISSGFGMRFHPVLGYTRMHKGIDFAVPTGTPVMAAGAGVVKFAGRENGYGNFILVDHGNGYSTAYGHLSRFAAGLRPGQRVRQGQVIAYSGMTGLATGPHLHYEIRIHNMQVNPVRVKIAQGRRLQGRELAAFLAERNRVDRLEAALPIQRTIAQANDLRDGADD